MSDASTHSVPTPPDEQPPKQKPVYKQPWFLALMSSGLLVVLVVAGVSVKTMNDHQNALIATVQAQGKADRDARAAAALKAKQAAAAARTKAAAVAAAAKAKKQAADLAKAQKDAADAKSLAKKAQNTSPKVVVVQPQSPANVTPYVAPGYTAPDPAGLYVAKVASMSTQSGAETYVSQIEAAGYPSDVFWSSNYSSMLPGYWVAAAGPFSTQSEAQSAADNLGGGAYVGYLG
jgi:hypothetical protein